MQLFVDHERWRLEHLAEQVQQALAVRLERAGEQYRGRDGERSVDVIVEPNPYPANYIAGEHRTYAMHVRFEGASGDACFEVAQRLHLALSTNVKRILTYELGGGSGT